jgi:hypothetical protein
MHIRALLCLLAFAAAILLTGCGGDQAVVTTSAPATGGAGATMLPNSGMTVAEARAQKGPEPIVIRAALIVAADGSARLCDLVAQSLPPQCGRPSIAVSGLPPELIDGLSEASGVRFSAGPVQLVGTIRDDVFINDPVALAAS